MAYFAAKVSVSTVWFCSDMDSCQESLELVETQGIVYIEESRALPIYYIEACYEIVLLSMMM